MAQNQSEDSIQAQYHAWRHNYYPRTRQLCYHIPNGGLRTAKEASKLKAMGVQAGICDYHHAIPANGYACLYIEFKEPGANMNTDHVKEQLKIHQSLREAGNRVVVCFSVEEAQARFKEYFQGTIWLQPL
jgi:hypothetical protein